jgi:hypothetical protein
MPPVAVVHSEKLRQVPELCIMETFVGKWGYLKERMVHCDIECLTMLGVSLVCGDWYTLSEDKSQKKYLKVGKNIQIVRALASKPRKQR